MNFKIYNQSILKISIISILVGMSIGFVFSTKGLEHSSLSLPKSQKCLALLNEYVDQSYLEVENKNLILIESVKHLKQQDQTNDSTQQIKKENFISDKIKSLKAFSQQTENIGKDYLQNSCSIGALLFAHVSVLEQISKEKVTN